MIKKSLNLNQDLNLMTSSLRHALHQYKYKPNNSKMMLPDRTKTASRFFRFSRVFVLVMYRIWYIVRSLLLTNHLTPRHFPRSLLPGGDMQTHPCFFDG
ncbi:uncharacterized protein BJX67DRAFT_238900 [Aspergillus lucknowensis]|uniref:Uncharacterized protein n=1 Tax=Aspergillus lucknowensis TaxID=176173 RepID=A0ABR4LGD1_9EURO